MTRQQALWEGFKKGRFISLEDFFFWITIGFMGAAFYGRYLRGDVFWPELVMVGVAFAMVSQIKWWRRRRPIRTVPIPVGDVLDQVGAAVKGLAPKSQYIVVLVGPDWTDDEHIQTRVTSDMSDDLVHYFFRQVSLQTGPPVN